jgi:cytochrome c oxidase subunit 2
MCPALRLRVGCLNWRQCSDCAGQEDVVESDETGATRGACGIDLIPLRRGEEGRLVRLHFGDPQIAIAAVFAVIAVLLAGAFVTIGVQAGSDVSVERVHRFGYWLRNRWLALLVVVGVLVVGISLFDLPYASGGADGRTVVKVTGGQFFWSLQPDRVPVGTRVRFDVTSLDVNHGFGLYSPGGHLIGELQAMPGYHNKLDLTLNRRGTYLIRCLEFCGLNHATMEGRFVVAGR